LRGRIEFASTGGGDAPALLLRAARQLDSLDPALARETYLDAWAAAHFAGKLARGGTAHEVSQAALSAPQPTSAPRASDLLLDGLSVLVIEGRAAAAPKLSRAVSAFVEGEIAVEEGFRWGFLAASAAYTMWDDESWHTILARQLQTARDTGLAVNLAIYLHALSTTAAWRGDFGMAASFLAEADAIAQATGTRLSRVADLILASSRGKEAEASALIEVEMRNASAAGQGLGIQTCQWVSAVLYNGLGRYAKALAEAQRASEEAPERWVAAFALPELIEAATRAGQARLAGDALERLAEAASVGDSDWGLGLLARSRALLTEGNAAEGSYRESIDRLSRTRLRPQLVRAHLLYGEWLRRENRRLDARAELRTAHELFVEIGMEAFAERARSELQATGEIARRHTVETRDDLTTQERQIAELARDGLSNPEIGARLFLSPRTVEWHLRRVFAKLGIRSRRELATALPSRSSETVSA
jgi:ATP/maltotriose-dependent transcriptional regulator MalT